MNPFDSFSRGRHINGKTSKRSREAYIVGRNERARKFKRNFILLTGNVSMEGRRTKDDGEGEILIPLEFNLNKPKLF